MNNYPGNAGRSAIVKRIYFISGGLNTTYLTQFIFYFLTYFGSGDNFYLSLRLYISRSVT